VPSYKPWRGSHRPWDPAQAAAAHGLMVGQAIKLMVDRSNGLMVDRAIRPMVESGKRDQHEQNRVRLQPSATEISRMEETIAWPARYLRSWPQLVRAVQAVAVARSRDSDTDGAARRLRLPGHVVRKWNGEPGDDRPRAALRSGAGVRR
jgi:hypothetical protein